MLDDARAKQDLQIDVAIHLAAHPISDGVNHFRSVLRRIDMDAKRAFAERRADHPDDRPSHFGRVGIGGFEAREPLQRLLGDAGIGAGFIFGGARGVRRSAGMGEVAPW